MNKLTSALQNLLTHNPINQYNWDIPNSCPIEIPKSIADNYSKNIYLKENLSDALLKDSSLDHHYWVINEWGGIKSFKRNDKNNEKIKNFTSELIKGKLSRNSFSNISSLSKIASFIDPENYTIYDSRVIYSLNWLLFNKSDSKSLFPQPAGRNSDISKYDQETIFRLSGMDFSYKPYNTAYHEYCNLIKTLSKTVFPDTDRPYYLEMLLFMIAPSEIIQDICTSVDLQIRTE